MSPWLAASYAPRVRASGDAPATARGLASWRTRVQKDRVAAAGEMKGYLGSYWGREAAHFTAGVLCGSAVPEAFVL